MAGIGESLEFKRMKKFVINAYPSSKSWEWRVNHMNQNQIIAIYFSIKDREKKKKIRKEAPKQITLFELYPDAMVVGGN